MRVACRYTGNVASCLLLGALLAASDLYATTKAWTGAVSAQWSNPENWVGGTPEAGDDLSFPVGAAGLSSVNDLPAGMVFGQIALTGCRVPRDLVTVG